MVKRYTPQDDALIVSIVKQYPNNLLYAFEQASKELCKSKKAISQRWYSKLSKDITAISVISQEVQTVFNQKNAKRPKLSLSDEQEFDIVVQLLEKLGSMYKQKLVKQILNIN